MKSKLFTMSALFACIIVLIAAAIADLNGRWKGTIKVPDGSEIQAVYNFKVDGDKLTGTAESPSGVVAIDSGKVAGNSFSFQVTVDGNDYNHKGIMYDDSCGVDIDFGGQLVHTTIMRDTAR
ncbi:MAG: glycoside hydrolase [Bacteroidota bacterium]|nr:glycoside hydrolase [Bacteroidota bacterium]